MNVGILGLGLIGGSLARAYALDGHTVLAAEKDESMLSFAILAGAVHGRLDDTNITNCNLILLAIYPQGSASWLEANAGNISNIPWRVLSFPASSTAGPICSMAPPWYWFPLFLTTWRCFSGSGMLWNPAALVPSLLLPPQSMTV